MASSSTGRVFRQRWAAQAVGGVQAFGEVGEAGARLGHPSPCTRRAQPLPDAWVGAAGVGTATCAHTPRLSPPQVFDPASMPEEDYLMPMREAVAAEEKRRAAQRSTSGRVEFVRGGTAPAPAGQGRLSTAEAIAAAQASAAALAARAAALHAKSQRR